MNHQVTVTNVDLATLIAEFKKAIVLEIRAEILAAMPKPDVEYISQQDVCKILKCSPYTVRKLVASNDLKIYSIGSILRYRKDEAMELKDIFRKR